MTKYQFLLKKKKKENWAFSSTISSFRSSTPNGWTSTPTIWSILRKANGKCHWLFALVKAPSGMPTGLWKGRLLMILSARKPYRTEWSIMHPLVLYFYCSNTFLVRLFYKYRTFFKRLSAAKVQHFFDIHKTLVAKNAFFYSISRAR